MLLNQKHQAHRWATAFENVKHVSRTFHKLFPSVKRSRLFMSGTLRLGQRINLPLQPRMPRETWAETNDDPGSFTYSDPAQSRCTESSRCLTLFLRAKDQVTAPLQTEENRQDVEMNFSIFCTEVTSNVWNWNSFTKQQHNQTRWRLISWMKGVALAKVIAVAVDCIVVLLRQWSNRRALQRVIFRTQRSLTHRLDH